MATFGKNVDIFQQIAAGNLQALRDLVASATQLVQQPLPSIDLTDLSKSSSQGPTDEAGPTNGKLL